MGSVWNCGYTLFLYFGLSLSGCGRQHFTNYLTYVYKRTSLASLKEAASMHTPGPGSPVPAKLPMEYRTREIQANGYPELHPDSTFICVKMIALLHHLFVASSRRRPRTGSG